ncbi:MAG: excisionase family DNA-binding protein [Desulfobacterales bacterium]|nr:excisionase family DNA-binding protein [Desulfobacterales bacterium]
MRDFYTRQELAKEMNVGVRTIDKWKREFGLPYHKFGSEVVFKKDEFEQWGKDRADAEIKKKKLLLEVEKQKERK